MSKQTTLGVTLRKARKKEKLTIDNLAARTGLHSSVIYKIEAGAIKNPSLLTVQKICQVLQIEIPTVS